MRGERIGVKLCLELGDLRLGESGVGESRFLCGGGGDELRGIDLRLLLLALALITDYSAVFRVDLDLVLIAARNEIYIVVGDAVVGVELRLFERDLGLMSVVYG